MLLIIGQSHPSQARPRLGGRARSCILRLGNVLFGERAFVKQVVVRRRQHPSTCARWQPILDHTRVYSQTCFDLRFPDCAKQPNIYVAPMGVKDGHMATDAERSRKLSRREFSVVHVMPNAFPPFFCEISHCARWYSHKYTSGVRTFALRAAYIFTCCALLSMRGG
jgi:hypothetical protein